MPGSGGGTDTSGDPPPTVVTSQVQPTRSSGPDVLVEERTEEIEKAKQKAIEEAKRKAEEAKAAEEKKKQEEEAKRKQAEESQAASGSGDGSGEGSASPADSGDGTSAPDPASYPDGPVVTPPAPPAPAPVASLIKVRVASYDNRSDAQKLAIELSSRGYATVTEPEQQSNGRVMYHVQVGAFRDEKAAKDLQKELKANGYDSRLVRVR